ncbi:MULTISPECIES: CpsD/CapB family tyrosine-protein kinase [unclassified Paenibacillus]|uniref:CpsD/CapB family tyrosine-protein kinase n=1 Tax=unclassified Paenibacillus TaxID=185978 RepID=UPI00020D71E8|nr:MULTISPECIES: CpsD/CapB family tyrosine-protein kinase [unclassified Paenibacillus]EGL19538.1 capsular exopolysaccharide family [Paenibacillus sp. HGF7]EPD82524.1 capsular exopolysaccharide family protein [Paenibacillus sp. HGH0039]
MLASTNNSKVLIADVNPKSQISEAYRVLRTNIQYSSIDKEITTILVTSAQPAEGKSTTVSNLAITYAQEEKNVLLIDADLRKPTMHKLFGISNRSGLTNLLLGEAPVREVAIPSHLPNLYLIPSGPSTPNPAEMLASKRMTQFIEQAKAEYDIVLIDSPPILAVTDAQILATKCEGVILVLNHGKVKREVAKRAVDRLEHVGVKPLGVVINNKTNTKTSSSYYSYYGESK